VPQVTEPTSLPPALGARLDALLAAADERLAARPAPDRSPQPVHTVYLPADRLGPDTARAWGDEALAALREHADGAQTLGVDAEVWRRVRHALTVAPVQDLRVDFEDGDGDRGYPQEDADALRAVALLRDLPAAHGIGARVKSLDAPTRTRALRTLDLLLSAVGGVPPGFVVTLPKVRGPEQVTAAHELLAAVDETLPGGPLRFEIQVETPEAVARIHEIVAVAGPRCAGLHYGTYDYSAALDVAAAHQSLDHPVADHAKAQMQLAAATAGLRVVDGSSNVLPVGDTAAVRSASALHQRLVDRSMRQGIYQGWDLHPAQLVSRYAAAFSFYRNGFPAAAKRLTDYRASRWGGVLDEPATARARAGYLRRGVDCGALDEQEVAAATGLGRSALDAV
jgi:citrate lyase beta subunit